MKHPTKKHEEGQHQRWQGYALLAAVVIAAGLELVSYVSYAYREAGLAVVGLAFVLWLGLAALPWRHWIGAPLRVMCIAMGVYTSLSNMSMLFGASMDTRIASAEQHESAREAAERAKKTLSAIAETGTVAELEATVAAANTAYEMAAKADTARMGEPSCFSTCQKKLTALQAAQDRLGQAKARDKADEAVQAANRTMAEVPKADANIMAASIAPYLGMDANKLARNLLMAFCIAGVIVATGMATMGQVALRMIKEGRMHDVGQKPNTRPLRPIAAEAPQLPARKRSRGRPGIMNQDKAYAILLAHATKTGGAFFASKAAIAEKLSEGLPRKLSPNTLTPWIKYWVDNGMLTMQQVSKKETSYIVQAQKAA